MEYTKKLFNIVPADRLHAIGEYYFSTKLAQIARLNAEGKKIINLGIGSPDMHPHPSVVEELSRSADIKMPHGYQSYRGIPELRNAFASWYSRYYHVALNAENEILPLIGSKEGIMHICMTYLNPDDEVLVPNPGYPTYTSAVRLAGAKPLYYSLLSNGQIDFSALEKLYHPKVKMIWINYPHMPTGALPEEKIFEKIIDFALKRNLIVCHDNPYSFILNPEKPRSIFEVKEAKCVAIELNSLSKSHNMAGWRVGMLTGHSIFINEIIKFKSNMDSGMFYALQKAAVKALELGDDWYATVNTEYRKRRDIVYQIAKKLNLIIEHQQAGLFIWAKISDTTSAYEFSDKILDKYKIFITPGGIFGSQGEHHIRISLCASQPILNEALERINA